MNLVHPYSINIASDGKIYVADQLNNRISVWTQSGNNFGNLTTFGSYGNNNDNLSSPLDVFAVTKDKILVVDYFNHRIAEWKAPAQIFYAQVTFDITAPATFTGSTATLTWPTISGLGFIQVKYCIRISKDKTLGTGVKTVCGLTGNSYTYNPNDPNGRTEAGLEDYYWQVAAQDSAGNLSQWSEVQNFKLDATTSLFSNESQTKLSIYPNPTHGKWHIVSLEKAPLKVFNAQGILVYSAMVKLGENEINISLSKGIYMVKVGNKVSKLIIE